MTLGPIISAPLAAQIHIATVLPAAVLGLWLVALSLKGSPAHRKAGAVYIALIGAATVSAFFIQDVNPGGFSWLHGLAVLVLVSLVHAWRAARAGNIRAHKHTMLGIYVFGVVVAGAFALSPGRILARTVFG